MPNRPTSDAAGRNRTAPERSPDYAHLSLEGLRAYRGALTTEENRVSYWRRIIQARLDLVRAADAVATTSVESLRDVFAEARVDSGRRALLSVVQVDDMPPLPDLVGLWSREPQGGNGAHNARLAHDLSKAEAQLSAYRNALHRRLSSATDELIARYRAEPSLCFSVLPLGPRRTGSGAVRTA